MLRASGTPLRADVQPPGSTGMCLVRKGVRAVVLTAYLQGLETILLKVGGLASALQHVAGRATLVHLCCQDGGQGRTPAVGPQPVALGCSNAFEAYGVEFQSPCPNFRLWDRVPVLGPWRQGTQSIGLQFGSKARGAAVGRFVTKMQSQNACTAN